MNNRDDLELRLATTLAPMLLAIATFSLTVMGLEQTPDQTIVDELFAFLGVFCLLAAAIIADSTLDKQNMTAFDRLNFLGFGYLLFCLVVGTMTAFIPILYEAKRAAQAVVAWDNSYIFFFATGISVVLKLMTYNALCDYNSETPPAHNLV